MIVVKYKEVYKYDFVKFGKHYTHKQIIENFDLLEDDTNLLEWAKSNDYHLIWTEQHPNT